MPRIAVSVWVSAFIAGHFVPLVVVSSCSSKSISQPHGGGLGLLGGGHSYARVPIGHQEMLA